MADQGTTYPVFNDYSKPRKIGCFKLGNGLTVYNKKLCSTFLVTFTWDDEGENCVADCTPQEIVDAVMRGQVPMGIEYTDNGDYGGATVHCYQFSNVFQGVATFYNAEQNGKYLIQSDKQVVVQAMSSTGEDAQY